MVELTIIIGGSNRKADREEKALRELGLRFYQIRTEATKGHWSNTMLAVLVDRPLDLLVQQIHKIGGRVRPIAISEAREQLEQKPQEENIPTEPRTLLPVLNTVTCTNITFRE